MKERPQVKSEGVLAIGNPDFGVPIPESVELLPERVRGERTIYFKLPGTQREIDSLRQIYGDSSTILNGQEASEDKLEALRVAKSLAKYRYLHFATHGIGNSEKPFQTSLILAGYNTHSAKPGLNTSPYMDGKLSAEEVLKFWHLDAELVTLSVCDSGVGYAAGGDGILGFAQAFLVAGSRSVCVTLWEVDDSATALLMERFYRNLTGKREGLAKPMGKSDALSESKLWLRNLTVGDVQKLSPTPGRKQKTTDVAKFLASLLKAGAEQSKIDTTKPFAHPWYWAAFILVGDPD